MNNKTELTEQQTVIEWCEYAGAGRNPEFKSIYHIVNEGKRSKFNGAELRAAGLKKGVPDLCLPCARGAYHALYIEMKKDETCSASEEQKQWIETLKRQGNYGVVCYGAGQAIRVLQEYISLEAGERMNADDQP